MLLWTPPLLRPDPDPLLSAGSVPLFQEGRQLAQPARVRFSQGLSPPPASGCAPARPERETIIEVEWEGANEPYVGASERPPHISVATCN